MMTKGDFVPGHDQKLRISIENTVHGLLSLKDLVVECENYARGDATEHELLRAIRRIFYKTA